jgi:DNA (cytosine-5)-methyltransferase 3A
MVAKPIRIGTIENNCANKAHDSKQYRVYSPDAKPTTLCGQGGGVGAKTGLYACPVLSEREIDYMFRKEGRTDYGYIQNTNRDKAQCLTANLHKGVPYNVLFEEVDGTLYFTDQSGKKVTVYEVKDGFITIKGISYPIKLADGYYIIRKLTPVECERLQTLPDGYTRAVSNTQRYKGLGNGWTAEVIIHILNGALKDVPRDEEIVVLSMYDGIGTGRYCLDKMGFTNVKYFAYEIDKYAKIVSASNYPDIIQLGDAFDVRNDDWSIEHILRRSKEEE